MELSEPGQLACPQCGHLLRDEPEEVVPTKREARQPADEDDGQIRIPFACPTCKAPLSIVIEGTPESGVAVKMEDPCES